MRRFLPHLSLLAFIVVLAAACGDDADTTTADAADDTPDGGDQPDGGDEPDDGTRPSLAGDWTLVSLTVDGAEVPKPDEPLEITIELGRINGHLGCNSFFGDLDAADDGTLTVRGLGQTEMACMEPGRMEFESAYGRALAGVTTWAVDPDGMTLRGDDAEIRYEPAAPPVHQPLAGTVWHFDTVYAGEGPDRTAENRADMEGVTLVVDGDQATISGPDCVATTTVEFAEGSEGAFAVLGAVELDTTPACEVVGLAADGIAAASGFMIDEHRLTFIGGPGETVGFSARP